MQAEIGEKRDALAARFAAAMAWRGWRSSDSLSTERRMLWPMLLPILKHFHAWAKRV
jgi:hypothetical protein